MDKSRVKKLDDNDHVKYKLLPMESILKKVLLNRSSIGCFGTVFIQQLIIASSSLWLTLLCQNIESKQNFTLFLILYLSSLLVPYLPEGISLIFNSTWKQNTFSYLIHRFVELRKDDALGWGNRSLKDETTSILTAEGQQTLNLVIDHIYYFVYYFLSVLLNIIAIVLLIEPKFAISYFISVVSVFLLIKIQYRHQTKLAKEAQGARIDLGKSLLKSWDNVLLGNKYNFTLWIQEARALLAQATKLNFSSTLFNQLLTLIATALIFLPSLGVAVFSLIEQRNEPAAIAALMLTLPRLFSVLEYTQFALSYIVQWPMHKAKLDMIQTILKPPQIFLHELEERISWQKLVFNPPLPFPVKKLLSYDKSFEESETLVRNYPYGRHTLRGENGCGKSTFLMVVKQHLREHAFLLPASHQLSFMANKKHCSSGEALRAHLFEIQSHVDVKVILLDEWDANLDDVNIKTISSIIDELSKDRLVIEVRHR